MATVCASGVFEVVHPGHLTYLTEAAKLGERLVVIVASDETAARRKRHPVVGEKQRAEVVAALKPVDEVVVGGSGDIYETIQKVKPDVLALGFDQDFDEAELGREFAERGLKTRVVRVGAKWSAPLDKSGKIIDSFKGK